MTMIVGIRMDCNHNQFSVASSWNDSFPLNNNIYDVTRISTPCLSSNAITSVPLSYDITRISTPCVSSKDFYIEVLVSSNEMTLSYDLITDDNRRDS